MVRRMVRTLCMGVALGLFTAATVGATDTTPAKAAPPAKAAATPGAMAKAPVKTSDEVAVFETTKGRMVAEFWEKDAPKTVANFKKLARQGFYDGTGFHRIIKGFMIQGGDPLSRNPKASDLGTGNPGYMIPDEFNSHKHVPGVLSMAHSSAPNSGGSQFFIMHGPAPFLDNQYSAFGHLIAGADVLNAIANTPCDPNPSMPGERSKPTEWTTVKSVKVITRDQWTAMNAPAKAAEKASATAKTATEVKSGMGMKAGMDMNSTMPKTAAPASGAKADSTKGGK